MCCTVVTTEHQGGKRSLVGVVCSGHVTLLLSVEAEHYSGAQQPCQHRRHTALLLTTRPKHSPLSTASVFMRRTLSQYPALRLKKYGTNFENPTQLTCIEMSRRHTE